MTDSSEQHLTTISVGQTEEESQTELTDQSEEALVQLDQSQQVIVPKLEPQAHIESVVLEDGSSYSEKEILEGVTEADIVAGDSVTDGDITGTGVLEETVQT